MRQRRTLCLGRGLGLVVGWEDLKVVKNKTRALRRETTSAARGRCVLPFECSRLRGPSLPSGRLRLLMFTLMGP